MTSRPLPQCAACVHWRSPLDTGKNVQTCTAFPEAIPEAIWWNRADHRQPFDNDGGIRWKSLLGAKYTIARSLAIIRNAVNPNDIDLSGVQHDFELHLNQILDHWTGITQRQINEIIAQVENAVDKGDIRRLAKLSASTADAEEALKDAMTSMALSAAQRVVDEAAAQGRNIDPVASDTAPFSLIATATAGLLVGALANAAGREALRRWTPGMSGSDVGSGVREHLDSLSGSFLKDNLGGALSHAETTGRVNTMLTGPSAAIYASEQLDGATCGPCRQINGKWIGNSDDPDIQAKIDAVYPRGYVGCLGGDRCRGQLVSVWREPGEGFVGATVGSTLATAKSLPRAHPGHDQKSHGRKGSGGRVEGKDLVGKLNPSEIRPDGVGRREATMAVVERQGFDGPPTVTDSAGVDAVIARGGIELYRGVGSAEFAEEFRSGQLHLSEEGTAPLGIGIYSHTERQVAEPFAGNGGLVRMALRPDARTIDYDSLAVEHQRRTANLSDDEYFMLDDPGTYAAAAGYDAILPTPGAPRADHTVVLNRTALVVQREPA